MNRLNAFIEPFRPELEALARAELNEILEALKSTGKVETKILAKDITLYVQQLAKGEITQDKFIDCLEDIRDRGLSQGNVLTALGQVRAKTLAAKLTDLGIKVLVVGLAAI